MCRVSVSECVQGNAGDKSIIEWAALSRSFVSRDDASQEVVTSRV